MAPVILLAFAGSMNCSRTVRPAVELLHISKSGGTSMCQLAVQAGLRNPSTSLDGNCLVNGAQAERPCLPNIHALHVLTGFNIINDSKNDDWSTFTSGATLP